MPNALFAFESRDAARAALRALDAAGLAPGAVGLHADEPGPHQKGLENADEIVTGGLVHNLVDLFQGVFEWGDSPHDAMPFEETVRRGGAVLSVDAADGDQQEEIERVMTNAGSTRRTGWKSVPTQHD